MKAASKIFGIGLSRTGTQSLAMGLRVLGFETCHYPRTLEEIKQHDAALDIPVACQFEFLDAIYPQARFIYTTREIESWLESCQKHYSSQVWRQKDPDEFTTSEMSVAAVDFTVYRTWTFDDQLFRKAYERHHERVTAYFKGRELLVLDIPGSPPSKVWSQLLGFLGLEQLPFPWENRSD